ncbi:MAG: DUF5685 family protein [Bacillota bacterium]|nr:DUF5685 family protein [Bacillota bacterium]
MLGYIVPHRPELKLREYELYHGYYCGICRSIGRRYGQVPRLVLSYDSVFLALALASASPEKESMEPFRCPVHPAKKRLWVKDSPAVDYAADMMLLLANYKVLDDCRDRGDPKALAEKLLLRRFFKKLMKVYGKKGIMIDKLLQELTELEEENCPSLDRAAEPFARLMEEVFRWPGVEGAEDRLPVLGRMGYHLGKWIYLIDAYDDIEENAEDGGYNPLIAQSGYRPGGEESLEEFRLRIRERTEFNLLRYLAELAEACKDMGFEKNQGLIDNIVYFGLLKKTEQVLGTEKKKGTETNDESV